MRIQVKLEVETPKVPNFLRTSDGQTLPLCAITDDGLRAVAAHWFADLLAKSKEQQRNKEIGS